MREFHKDKQRYFEMQYLVTRDHILPFIEQTFDVKPGHRVLEIGCAEAGVLWAFRERGCDCLGIELSSSRTDLARQFHDALDLPGKIDFRNDNIYDIDPDKDLDQKFDVIVLKDVIEHIPDQERFIPVLRRFLNDGGMIFFGFPPWLMPFGGHQQLARSKVMSTAPYYHILPKPIYRGVLKSFGESDQTIEVLMEIKDTRISIQRFESIVRRSGLKKVNKQSWFLNSDLQIQVWQRPFQAITNHISHSVGAGFLDYSGILFN